ncbi:28S ribosomal protein S7, mitochondrial, partial [Eufriesea mexicana]
RYNLVNEIQFYSVFSPTYKKPIYGKENQKVFFERYKGKNILRSKIKPSSSSETCSEFYDALVCKFTNHIMREGKKQIAKKLVADTFENIKIMQLQKYYNASLDNQKNIILDPKKILHEAVNNCLPILHLQKIMKVIIEINNIYTSYKVPVPVDKNRAVFLSMNWLIKAAQDKGNAEKFGDVMAQELINAAQNKGKAVKKMYDLHKQCEANRAYAHYRWI